MVPKGRPTKKTPSVRAGLSREVKIALARVGAFCTVSGYNLAGLPDPQILCRFLAPVCHHLVAHFGALIEVAQTSLLDSRDMHKDVLATAVRLDKAKALRRVEPFHGTCRHVVLQNIAPT